MTQFKIAVCVFLQNEANFSLSLQRALLFARELGALNGLSPERSQCVLLRLAAPDAGLGLAITRIEARRVERHRTAALTRRRLGRTIRRAGLGGALSESQFAGSDRSTFCERIAKHRQQDGRAKGEPHVTSHGVF